MSLREMRPDQLLALARADLARRGYVGDASDLVTEAGQVWDAAVAALVAPILTPPRLVRDFVFESGAKLQTLSYEAFNRGAAAAGGAIDELSGRLAGALASWGASTGQVVDGLLGARPIHFALLGAGLLVLLGAGLFLTPGGQALAPNLLRALVRP